MPSVSRSPAAASLAAFIGSSYEAFDRSGASTRYRQALGPPPFDGDHVLVGFGDAVHHALFVAELLDQPVTVRDQAIHAGFAVGGGLLFNRLRQPLHGTVRLVVDLEQHVGHTLERLLHLVARAERALLPTLDGRVGLFDSGQDGRGSTSRT